MMDNGETGWAVSHERVHDQHDKVAEERWASHRREHDAESRALGLATKEMDRRLDAMNEFRDQLSKQAITFAGVDVVDHLESKVDVLREELRGMIATEREERRDQQNLRVGKSQGLSLVWAVALGVLAVVGTLVGMAGTIFAIMSN